MDDLLNAEIVQNVKELEKNNENFNKNCKKKKPEEHQENKPFQCDICTFSLKTQLRTHISSVHENKKPYKCEICDTCFSRKSHLAGHIKAVHEGEKPYKCEICGLKLASSQSRNHHINAIHGINTKWIWYDRR